MTLNYTTGKSHIKGRMSDNNIYNSRVLFKSYLTTPLSCFKNLHFNLSKKHS